MDSAVVISAEVEGLAFDFIDAELPPAVVLSELIDTEGKEVEHKN